MGGEGVKMSNFKKLKKEIEGLKILQSVNLEELKALQDLALSAEADSAMITEGPFKMALQANKGNEFVELVAFKIPFGGWRVADICYKVRWN